MPQTIKDLWNGNISPFEHCGAHDPQADHLTCLMERNRETLCASLTPAQQETFQKYIDCSDEYLLRIVELAFSEGFCLATRLTAEALV